MRGGLISSMRAERSVSPSVRHIYQTLSKTGSIRASFLLITISDWTSIVHAFNFSIIIFIVIFRSERDQEVRLRLRRQTTIFEFKAAPTLKHRNQVIFFVRNGIYNSLADYDSTWRLCVSVPGKTLLLGNFWTLCVGGLKFFVVPS